MKLRKFDTKVQHLKYKILREIAREAWNDSLLEKMGEIPKRIIPGKESTMRCCVYKERAIVWERMKLAMGGDKENPNVIEVIDIACDECPVGGYDVTEACRGCIAHRCEDVCRMGAITFDEHQKAHIDKSKCVNCGQCLVACPVGSITEKSAINQVWDAIADPEKVVLVQTAPAVRAAIGEEFGMPIGSVATKQMVGAMLGLGFDKVFDTDTAADLTILEEGTPEEVFDHTREERTKNFLSKVLK